MIKRAASLLLGLALLAGASVPVLAEAPGEAAPSYTVYVNEDEVGASSAELVDGNAYVSLCTTALAMRPDAAADFQHNQMTIQAADFALSAQPGAGYLEVNGRYLYLPAGVRPDKTGADVMVPVDMLVYALGAVCVRDDEAGDVRITVPEGAAPLAPGDEYYDAAQVDLMARVIRSESGSGTLSGQIAVGNVLQNRVANPIFPNTLAEVIGQPGQFPGATATPPTPDNVIAAKLCLDGAVVVPTAYWFNRAGLSCWASQNKTRIATIDGQDFYG